MKGKVLIIEDNNEIADVIAWGLMEAGCIVVAADEQEYKKDIRDFEPDLLLLDYWMGNKPGDQICIELKTAAETRHIPIILISATHDVEATAAICKSDDWIAKPFNVAELQAKVEKWLTGESATHSNDIKSHEQP